MRLDHLLSKEHCLLATKGTARKGILNFDSAMNTKQNVHTYDRFALLPHIILFLEVLKEGRKVKNLNVKFRFNFEIVSSGP